MEGNIPVGSFDKKYQLLNGHKVWRFAVDLECGCIFAAGITLNIHRLDIFTWYMNSNKIHIIEIMVTFEKDLQQLQELKTEKYEEAPKKKKKDMAED